MTSATLAGLTAAGHLWQGAGHGRARWPAIPSGRGALDALLGGGWPRGVLVELLVTPPGSGELELLLPALVQAHADEPAALPADGRATGIALIAPPHVPYAPAWAQQGIAPHRLLVVMPAAATGHPATPVLWAMEELLAADACAAVLAWTDTAGATALRRLQLAAGSGRALAVLLRPAGARRERSPAALRLALETEPDGQRVEVLRNRFGGTGQLRWSAGHDSAGPAQPPSGA